MDWLKRITQENKGFILFLFLMAIFRSSFADINRVPTGSMKPTIVEGDRIVINKLAYDIQLPLLNTKLFKLGDPKRGDIVVFQSKVSDLRLVKRVIGVPGDVIAMQNNQLFINNTALKYSAVEAPKAEITTQTGPSKTSTKTSSKPTHSEQLEYLLGLDANRAYTIRTRKLADKQYNRYSAFAPVKVPEGYYLVLGDNRDNSADSRVIGLVPRHEIIGRSQQVIMSLNPDNYYLPRAQRFFKKL